MNATTLNRPPPTTRPPNAGSERSSLLRLQLSRGILAVAWAVAWAHAHVTLDARAIALLVVYPLIDAASSLVDYRTQPSGSERPVTALNGGLSALAIIAFAVAGTHGVAPTLIAFGAWAIVSGAAQLTIGLRRRGPSLGKQWPMLIAGGLSFAVGISYVIQATGEHASLDVLSVYATGGGVFFIVQAGLLAWRTRQLQRRSI